MLYNLIDLIFFWFVPTNYVLKHIIYILLFLKAFFMFSLLLLDAFVSLISLFNNFILFLLYHIHFCLIKQMKRPVSIG